VFNKVKKITKQEEKNKITVLLYVRINAIAKQWFTYITTTRRPINEFRKKRRPINAQQLK